MRLCSLGSTASRRCGCSSCSWCCAATRWRLCWSSPPAQGGRIFGLTEPKRFVERSSVFFGGGDAKTNRLNIGIGPPSLTRTAREPEGSEPLNHLTDNPYAHAALNVVRGPRLPERSASGKTVGPTKAFLERRWWADAGHERRLIRSMAALTATLTGRACVARGFFP
jgi:hypothetical protein